MTLFNFGRANHLGTCGVVDDDDYSLIVGYWVSGRIFGRYISMLVPWKHRRKP